METVNLIAVAEAARLLGVSNLQFVGWPTQGIKDS